MFNDRFDRAGPYPFDRLRALLDPIPPWSKAAPISLALGEPQHPPPDAIRREAAAHAGLWGRYPPTRGTPEIRRAVADWLARRYRLEPGRIDPEVHVVPVSGTREALFLAALAATPARRKGRKPVVLMPNPFYQTYLGAALAAGAEPVFLPALPENGHLPDLAAVDAGLLERTALAYYCTPANPQGAVASRGALEAAVRLARRYGFVLASDECYSEIYDRGAPPPPGALEAALAVDDGPGDGFRGVAAFNSLSKRSSAPGLRSGFVAGDGAFLRRFARLRDYGGAQPPLPLLAAAAALWRDEDHVAANRELYRRKFDLAEEALAGRFGFYRPPGGFYLWLEVGDGEDAARRLWRDAGIRVIPGAYLARTDDSGANPGRAHIRCALVHDLDTTAAALERLARTL